MTAPIFAARSRDRDAARAAALARSSAGEGPASPPLSSPEDTPLRSDEDEAPSDASEPPLLPSPPRPFFRLDFRFGLRGVDEDESLIGV